MIYAYDINDTALYGTANNRLMTESLQSTAGMATTVLSTKYYFYTFAGNVERVVTELVSPAAGEPKYGAVRYEYAANAQTATYVLGETWDVDGPDSGTCPDNYTVTFAREYRYDGARARYFDRMHDEQQALLGNVVSVLSTWTDYDGNNTYNDFTVSGNTVTIGDRYELALRMSR